LSIAIAASSSATLFKAPSFRACSFIFNSASICFWISCALLTMSSLLPGFGLEGFPYETLYPSRNPCRFPRFNW
jgi:hypothetical protein